MAWLNKAIFYCIMDAYNATGIDFRLISLVCKGKRNSTGGYKWRFK